MERWRIRAKKVSTLPGWALVAGCEQPTANSKNKKGTNAEIKEGGRSKISNSHTDCLSASHSSNRRQCNAQFISLVFGPLPMPLPRRQAIPLQGEASIGVPPVLGILATVGARATAARCSLLVACKEQAGRPMRSTGVQLELERRTIVRFRRRGE